MKYVFGFNITRAKELGLNLEELYVLKWIIYMYKNGNMIESGIYPEHFLIMHSVVAKECCALSHTSKDYVEKIMHKLSGKNSNIQNQQYPLNSVISTERGYRNCYYKINKNVVEVLMSRENSLFAMEQILTDEFIGQYKQISAIYDFKHRFDAENPSRVLLDSQQIIKDILEKTYIGKYGFDAAWISKQKLEFFDNPSFEGILAIIRIYAGARNSGGWLASSKPISLPSFFYNPHTRKCLFIQLLQGIHFSCINIPEEEKGEYQKEVDWLSVQCRMDSTTVYNNLFPIYTYLKEYYIQLQAQAKRNGKGTEWQKRYGEYFKWKYFISDLVEYIQNQKYEVKAEYIGHKNKFWFSFIRYIYVNYRIMLSFDIEFYKKISENSIDNGDW